MFHGADVSAWDPRQLRQVFLCHLFAQADAAQIHPARIGIQFRRDVGSGDAVCHLDDAGADLEGIFTQTSYDIGGPIRRMLSVGCFFVGANISKLHNMNFVV